MTDPVTHRSSHASPVLRGGGTGIVLALVAAVAATADLGAPPAQSVVLAALLLAVVGFVDDLFRGTAWQARLTATALVGLAAATAVTAGAPAPLPAALAVGLGAFWITGFTNVFNFMDGINGIAGLHGVVVGVALALAAHWAGVDFVIPLALAAAGASAGFLPFNWGRARVFLGDVGSYGLGGALAVIAYTAWVYGVPIEACVGPFVPYLADTSVTLARRVARGAPFHEAHREHAYQRLTQLGCSHPRVAIGVALASAATAALGLVSTHHGGAAPFAAAVAMVAVAALYLVSPDVLVRARARRPMPVS